MGGLIMTHSDDEGLIVPPRLATTQVVIVPIPKPSEELDAKAKEIMDALKAKGVRVSYDNDDQKRPGFKFAENELKGIPVRLGLGMRDVAKGVIEVARRDTKEKSTVPMEGIADYIENLLEEIQDNLFQRALKFREDKTTRVDTFEEFQRIIEGDKPGFISAHWDGTSESELKIKELTKATIRCIPNEPVLEDGVDLISGEPSKFRVLFAKAY
jgi:prolyl-tRNA synthetase